MNARDGRVFYLDNPEGVIAETMRRAGKVEIPVDYDHQIDFSEKNGQPAPDAGWIKSVEVQGDDLWALVQWTPQAVAMITSQQYRYISTTFRANNSCVITMFERAALTNNPARELTQLAQRQSEGNDATKLATRVAHFQAHVASMIGLEYNADETKIFASLKATLEKGASIDNDEVNTVVSLLSSRCLSKELSADFMRRL